MTSCTSPYLPNLEGNQVYNFSLSAAVFSVLLLAFSGRYGNLFCSKTTTLTILANCHNIEHMWAASKYADTLFLSVTNTRNIPLGFVDVLSFRFSTWISIVPFKLPPLRSTQTQYNCTVKLICLLCHLRLVGTVQSASLFPRVTFTVRRSPSAVRPSVAEDH